MSLDTEIQEKREEDIIDDVTETHDVDAPPVGIVETPDIDTEEVNIPEENIFQVEKEICKPIMLKIRSIICNIFKFLFNIKFTDTKIRNITNDSSRLLGELFDAFPIEIDERTDYDDFCDCMENTFSQPFDVYHVSVKKLPMVVIWERITDNTKKYLFEQLLILKKCQQDLLEYGSRTEINDSIIDHTRVELKKLLPEKLRNSDTIDGALNFVKKNVGGELSNIMNGDFDGLPSLFEKFSECSGEFEDIDQITTSLLGTIKSNPKYGGIFSKLMGSSKVLRDAMHNNTDVMDSISSRERENINRRKRLSEHRETTDSGTTEDEYVMEINDTGDDWLSTSVPQTRRRKKANSARSSKRKKKHNQSQSKRRRRKRRR